MSIITPINADLDSLRSQCPSIFATEKHPARSKDYTFISTLDQIKALMDEGFYVAAAKQARTRIPGNEGYTKHMVRMRAPGFATKEIAPEVILINAHNGGGASRIMGGALVFACLNGLIVSEGRIECVHIPHRGDVLKDVIEGCMLVMSHARRIAEIQDAWKSTRMSRDTQIEFARKALLMRWPLDEQGEPSNSLLPESLLVARREADVGDNLWNTFNRVQENVIAGGLSYAMTIGANTGRQRIRNVKSRPVKGVDADVKLNQSLWALGEEFALAA